MTPTLFSEAATRPKSPPAPPRYTEDEDATIRAMLAEGATHSEIATTLGRTIGGIRYRTERMLNVYSQHGRGPRHDNSHDHCQRCGVLLAVAPGTDGVCAWCAKETARKGRQ